jgi:hypothetical protein
MLPASKADARGCINHNHKSVNQDLISGLQVVSAKVEQARDKAEAYRGPQFNKDRCFTLLVIDDQNTDW